MPIRPENRSRYPKNWRDISTRTRQLTAHQHTRKENPDEPDFR